MNSSPQSVDASRTFVETDRFLGLDDVVFPPRDARTVRLVPPSVCEEAENASRRTPKSIEQPTTIATPTRQATTVSPADPAPAEPAHAPSVERISIPSGSDRQSQLDALRRLHEEQCPYCNSTHEPVMIFGEGSASARVFFVGEVPTEAEIAARRPLAGLSGGKLEEMIRAMKLSGEDVYLANILKSPLPELRPPSATELAQCGPYLRAQIEIIKPAVIVTLGGPASKHILASELGITRLRGVWGEFKIESLTIPVMPTFHPAYLLRNYTDETRAAVWHDLKQVIERLRVNA